MKISQNLISFCDNFGIILLNFLYLYILLALTFWRPYFLIKAKIAYLLRLKHFSGRKMKKCRNDANPNEFFLADITVSVIMVVTMAAFYGLIMVRNFEEKISFDLFCT